MNYTLNEETYILFVPFPDKVNRRRLLLITCGVYKIRRLRVIALYNTYLPQ